jgi:flagellin
MALAIATNNAALNAAASASSVNRDMETSMARLSSGKRINSASDDAAGVAISSRLSAEIRGTDQSIRNALDGQALIDTAEGAHKEIENILQRMREVSVQAANDTNNDQDRQNLQAEMNALITEIDRIAGTTTWAGEKLMESESGSFFSFQVGAATGEKNQIDVTIGGMGANILGFATPPADDAADDSDSVTPAVTGDPVASISGSTLTVDGTAAADGDLVLSFAAAPGDPVASMSGPPDYILTVDPGAVGRSGDLAFSFDSSGPITITLDGSEEDVDAIATTIATQMDTSVGGSVSTNNGNGTVTFNFPSLSDSNPYYGTTDIQIDDMSGDNTPRLDGVAGADITVPVTAGDTGDVLADKIAAAVNAVAGDETATSSDDGSGTVTFDFTDSSGDYYYAPSLSISADTTVAQAVAADDSGSDSDSDTPAAGTVPTAPVTSVANADDARVTIKAIDAAIQTVNIQRSELGAVSNRLSHTVNNLTNISSNLSAARGGIEDADFAHETTMLAKNQILQQASTAMLAQANASKQNVLSLLQG